MVTFNSENNPLPTLVRRKTASSFMLIVYRSSSADDYVDLQIPDDDQVVEDGEVEDVESKGETRDTSTVSAVMATVEQSTDGSTITMVPTVVITETVSTINITHDIIDVQGDIDTTTKSTTQVTESTSEVVDEHLETTTEDEDDTADIVEKCRKYNACVVYLIQEDEGKEMDVAEILSAGSGMNRRSGLSVGTAIIDMEKIFDVILPRNTIATITVSQTGIINNVDYESTIFGEVDIVSLIF